MPVAPSSWNDTMTRVSALHDQLDGMKRESRHPAQRQQERIAALLGEIQGEYVRFFEGEITQCPPEEAQRIQTKVRISLDSLCALAKERYGQSMDTPPLPIPHRPPPRARLTFRMQEHDVVGRGLDDVPRLLTDTATRRAAAILGHEMTAEATT